MKAVILAAGYATRLYPLTLNTPKPLLKVGCKTIMDHLFEKLREIPAIDMVYIVTNDRFYTHFADWARDNPPCKPATIINDGTSSEDTRLGAIGDLRLVIEKEGIKDDIMVMAGDNLMDFSLKDFYDYHRRVNGSCVCLQKIKSPEALKRMGVVLMDEKNRIVSFEEKPENPISDIGASAIYIYRREALPLIGGYLAAGGNPDAPGYLIEWLYRHEDIYGYLYNGSCYDIGTPEAYKRIQEIYPCRD